MSNLGTGLKVFAPLFGVSWVLWVTHNASSDWRKKRNDNDRQYEEQQKHKLDHYYEMERIKETKK